MTARNVMGVRWWVAAAMLAGAFHSRLAGQIPATSPDAVPAARNIKVVCDRWPDGSSLRQFATDAVRLSDARTEKDQALAVLRWMRRWTMFTNGTPPKDHSGAVLDDLKILHVFGAHWCDGRALLMENLWRSIGGRAYKLYIPDGYTLALVHWTDDDGVARWHQIHASRGWYLYDRPGKLIATPDQIGADMSLMFRPSVTGMPRSGHPPRPWNWIAVGHRPFSTHDVTLDLRPGESYVRQWGNGDVPFCNNVADKQYDDGEHGPYPITYGNGRFVSTIDLAGGAAAGGRRELLWPVRLPHLVADAWLAGKLPAGLTVQFSSDGKVFFDVPGGDGGRVELGRKNPAEKNLLGRYRFVLKLSWPADAATGKVELTVVTQHNLFSLPQLWPGRNHITVSGELPAGVQVSVDYQWDDASGPQKHSQRVSRTPFTYEINASGKEWTDVRCRYLTISAADRADQMPPPLPAPGQHDPASPASAWLKPKPPATHMDQVVGDKYPGPVKKTADYLADLKDPTKRVEALDGLMVLRDSSAGAALTELLYSNEDMELEVRGRVVQAIFWSLDHKAAFDILLPVVARDPKVKWAGEATAGRDEEGTSTASPAEGWKSISSLIAHLAGMADYQPAVPVLIDGFNRGVGRFNRPAYLRAFGRMKVKAAVPLCVRNLREHSDISASAAEALGLIGDESVVPDLIRAVQSRIDTPTHQAILYVEAGRALGRLNAKTPEAVALLEKMLAHGDEEVRGAAAEALGKVGGEKHAHALRFAASKEPFPWVRKIMTASAGRLDTVE